MSAIPKYLKPCKGERMCAIHQPCDVGVQETATRCSLWSQAIDIFQNNHDIRAREYSIGWSNTYFLSLASLPRPRHATPTPWQSPWGHLFHCLLSRRMSTAYVPNKTPKAAVSRSSSTTVWNHYIMLQPENTISDACEKNRQSNTIWLGISELYTSGKVRTRIRTFAKWFISSVSVSVLCFVSIFLVSLLASFFLIQLFFCMTYIEDTFGNRYNVHETS